MTRPDRLGNLSEVGVVAQRHLAEAFVELADTLVDGFDAVDFLHLLARRTAGLTGAGAVGLVVTDQRDRLRPAAASSEQTHLLELFELQSDEGPGRDCYASGRPVRHVRLADGDGRWPRFAPVARDAGFAVVDAVPMRLRGRTIGAMNLFGTGERGLDDADVDVAQGLADIATVGILAERRAAEQETLAEQLQATLNGRILVEQAKGVLAERYGWSMDEAFGALRRAAHERSVLLRQLAAAVVAGEEITAGP